MGLVGRHDYHLAFPDPNGLTRYRDISLAIEHVDEGIEGGRMLTKSLPLPEGEQRQRACFLVVSASCVHHRLHPDRRSHQPGQQVLHSS